MRSEEALYRQAGEGTRRHPSMATRTASVGTIKKRWGDPNYTALDVLLDDGTQSCSGTTS